MELGELRAQEDFEHILRATLQRGWSDQYGEQFEVGAGGSVEAQRWLVQPMLSAYFVEGVTHPGRRFMTDRFRYTPVRHRMAPQWLLGTIIGARPTLRWTAPTAFWVTPPVPNAHYIVIIPGSRRIRLFDFDRGVTRSLAKEGFGSASVRKETEVRGGATDGPFVRITEFDPRFDWFEEPIVSGFVLPRCPPWMNRRDLASRAIALLKQWTVTRSDTTDSGERAEQLVHDIIEALARVQARFGSLVGRVRPEILGRLQRDASKLGCTETATVHGDFQPGNILVELPSRTVLITDWENIGIRFRHYDAFTYILRARYGRGLDGRIGRFVESGKGDCVSDFLPRMPDRSWRTAAAALFLLEDLERALTDVISAPYTSVPLGLRSLCEELPAIVEALNS